MFHNSNIRYFKEYKNLVYTIKHKYKFIDEFGITVFNIEQLKEFSKIKEIREIQIPYNLIDYRKFNNVINLSKILGLRVQVRSIFGAGLFTGNYKINSSSNYHDPIRRSWKADNKVNVERYKLFTDLESKLKNFSFKEKKSFNIK